MKKLLPAILKAFISIISIVVGLVILIVAMIGLVDPIGTKLADDSDPFGDPGGPWYPLFLIFVSLFFILWPVVLKIYRDLMDEKRKSDTHYT